MHRALPSVDLMLLDGSPAMLAAARARVGAEATYVEREWAAAMQRMSFDHLATVEDQLAWLRDAGFGEVDCLFKHHVFAVIVALRGH